MQRRLGRLFTALLIEENKEKSFNAYRSKEQHSE
jgi:hypothetical protein